MEESAVPPRRRIKIKMNIPEEPEASEEGPKPNADEGNQNKKIEMSTPKKVNIIESQVKESAGAESFMEVEEISEDDVFVGKDVKKQAKILRKPKKSPALEVSGDEEEEEDSQVLGHKFGSKGKSDSGAEKNKKEKRKVMDMVDPETAVSNSDEEEQDEAPRSGKILSKVQVLREKLLKSDVEELLTLRKGMEIKEESEEMEVAEDESDGSDNQDGIVERNSEPPVPAPRRCRTPDSGLDEITPSEEDLSPPAPAPRKKSPSNTETPAEDSTKKGRRKKRKATEILAHVLKRETKKVPSVAAVLQEAEEAAVEKDYNGLYSPWDSPPPPTSLEKVYVQHKYGFSVKDWGDFHRKEEKNERPKDKYPADVALAFHCVWSRLCVFSHGVVAGVACCHALAVAAALASTQNNIKDFVQFYHFLSLKIHFAVYVFTSLCLVSCLDRLDIGRMKKTHIEAMGRSHGTLLVTFGYLLSMALTLAAHRHTAAIEAYSSDVTLWNAQGLEQWTCLVTIRDGLLLLCWVFLSCSGRNDLLQEKLASMCVAQREQGKPDLWHISSEGQNLP